ncbi:MAG: putative porin [Verrucomicrobiae bacterium]|nr:putative porin [Verrucomicrobiae bacterium]
MKHKSSKRHIIMMVSLAALVAMATGPAASGNDAILDLLVKKGLITQREANDIREQADVEMAKSVEVANKVKVPSFLTSLEWAGDLRLRAEYFSFENDHYGKNAPPADLKDLDERLRWRYRARVGVKATLQDWAQVGFRASSTGDNGDVVSTNQTLTDDFSRKEFRIDLAYVTLTPPFADWFSLTGGKMNNPIWQPQFLSPMVYDFDVTPEGVAGQINYTFGDKQQYRAFANVGAFPLNEVSGDVHDIYMYDFQIGAEAKVGPVKATLSGGYYTTRHLGDLGINYSANTASPKSSSPNKGNSADVTKTAAKTIKVKDVDGKTQTITTTAASEKAYYVDDFGVWYARGDIAWTIREKPLWGTPCVLTFSGEYLKNGSKDYAEDVTTTGNTNTLSQCTGYTFQAMFGGNKKQGEWSVGYQYKVLEANATWDAITDSDWGSGGTDRRGHVVAFTYNIREWWQLAFKTFVTTKISDTPNATVNAVRGWKGEDMLRVQVDTSFKF